MNTQPNPNSTDFPWSCFTKGVCSPEAPPEEMAQPVRTAACGGTHRLSGLALAVKKRKAAGLPIDGQYAAAQKFVANYQNYAYRLQNGDG